MAYTMKRIDAASVTKDGLEIFNRLPDEIKAADIDGRIRTITSLMTRNASKAWRAMEALSRDSELTEWYYSKAWRQPDEESRQAMRAKGDAAAAKWQTYYNGIEESCERRLGELVAILSTVTGYAWSITASGGGMGHVLVIPDGLKGNANSTSYHEQTPAIWISGN